MTKEITVCTRCIMDDSSDDSIVFDEEGHCNYCTVALSSTNKDHLSRAEGAKKLDAMLTTLKAEGRDKPFDCLMGISGGLDSSYLAFLGAAKWGLRIAAVHVDDGYDTEISVANIDRLCNKAGIELITIVPDSEQFNSLTKAYMKAGVPNLAAPQDNILFASLYEFARENNISYFLSGSNWALESILQKGNTWSAYDTKNIKDIHRLFGEKPIDKLTFISQRQKILNERVLGLRTLAPLNYVDYNRDRAFKELSDFCDFQYYGRKHLENYLTAFVQLCWFPEKFNVDKRSSHLSSMIVSGQMTREEALREMREPLFDEAYMRKVKDLICEKTGMDLDELEALISAPGHQHDEYATDRLVNAALTCYRRVRYWRSKKSD